MGLSRSDAAAAHAQGDPHRPMLAVAFPFVVLVARVAEYDAAASAADVRPRGEAQVDRPLGCPDPGGQRLRRERSRKKQQRCHRTERDA
jgi:hypothetical protein